MKLLDVVIYVATTVTITTLVILAAGPKREYPGGGGGSTREARIINVTNRTVFVHSFTGSSTYTTIGDE